MMCCLLTELKEDITNFARERLMMTPDTQNTPTDAPDEVSTDHAATDNTPQMEPIKPPISYDDFVKLDLRIATITEAEYHPNADRLIKLQLNDGTAEGRQICAGIRGHYEPDELVGKQLVIVANLEPRKIRGEMSYGMLLAASDKTTDPDNMQVIVITPDKPLPPGSTIS